MLAIEAHDVVGVAQLGDCARRDGLLADVEVKEAVDPAARVHLGRFLFKAPDAHHLAEQVAYERLRHAGDGLFTDRHS